jgi:predicted dehydrogenase
MKCIVTGLGGRGLHWVRQLKQRDDCEIVGYVEPVEANRQRAIEQEGVPAQQVYSSLDEAIAQAGADFLMDVTPPAVHHEVAEKAFAAGLHVLGEKPLSDNFATARRVVELGQKSGVQHMITQNYRFGSQPRTTRRAIGEGLIGKPGQCDVRFYMNWADAPGSHYVTEPFMLINDMMVHHFDLMRYVLNEEPVDVQAVTWNLPWGWHAGDAAHAIVFNYASGLVATHVAVGCAVGSRTTYNGDWRIEGPNGSIDWNGEQTTYSHLHRTDHPVDHRPIEHLPVPPGEQAILDEFFAAIRENREPECSAADNLQSLAMVFGAIQSAREGRKVSLAELS